MLGQWVEFEYGLNIRKQGCIVMKFPGFYNCVVFLQEDVLILLTIVEFKGIWEFIVLFLQLLCRSRIVEFQNKKLKKDFPL